MTQADVLMLVRSAIQVRSADLEYYGAGQTLDFEEYHKAYLATGAHWEPAKKTSTFEKTDPAQSRRFSSYPTFAWNAGSLPPLHLKMEMHRDDPERVGYWIFISGIDAKRHKLSLKVFEAGSKRSVDSQEFETNVNENPGLKGMDTEAMGSGFQLSPGTRVSIELSLRRQDTAEPRSTSCDPIYNG